MNPELANLLRASVPLFRGFPPDEVEVLLSLCRIRSFRAGDVLMQSGSPSTEMFLILSGEVLVRTPKGLPLVRLARPETVGEMGIFTGDSRSATVEGRQDGTLVVIARADLLKALAEDPPMAIRMYKNVIDILSRRLRNENLHIQMYRDQVQDLEAKVPSGAEPPEEASGAPLNEDGIIDEFYRSIGVSDVSTQRRSRDRETYRAMGERGLSDAQIQQIARWTAKNIRGIKAFTLVKYAIDDALKASQG
ncbi:MAG: cyclic nucleotide-binding domain-containing protein [Candidatus Latescibacteria bacterium]|nr:cyclic nucleotide-binding domain-containing protein [Candidatus Latescibacterota bacterium]